MTPALSTYGPESNVERDTPTKQNRIVTSNVSGNFEESFAHYQRKIYLNGVKGVKSPMTTNPELWEAAAQIAMSPEAFAYAKGGAGAGATIEKNREAFKKWSIIPRMARANNTRSLKVKVFGEDWPAPVAMAPVGVNRIFHP